MSIRTVSAAAIVAALLFVPQLASAQKLVILVRHAERADGGSMSATAETDPLLSAAGEARATRLAGMLADAGIKAVFATEFRRTQNTAKPVAARLGLTVQTMASANTAALIAKLKAEHAGDVVLIVAHSSTMPGLIKAYGGPEMAIGEDDYSNLFVIVPATGAITRIHF